MNKRPDFAADLGNVKSDVTMNVAKILSVVREDPKTREPEPVIPDSGTNAVQASKPEATKVKSADRRPRSSSKPALASGPIALVPFSSRMPPETKKLLKEVALREALKGSPLDAEWKVLNAALLAWFKQHGYGRRLSLSDDSLDESAEPTEDAANAE